MKQFLEVRSVMIDLIRSRKLLLGNTQTQDQCRDLKAKITTKIDWGNK